MFSVIATRRENSMDTPRRREGCRKETTTSEREETTRSGARARGRSQEGEAGVVAVEGDEEGRKEGSRKRRGNGGGRGVTWARVGRGSASVK